MRSDLLFIVSLMFVNFLFWILSTEIITTKEDKFLLTRDGLRKLLFICMYMKEAKYLDQF
jgi:hypothetical protein